jgi:hypothetical protein
MLGGSGDGEDCAAAKWPEAIKNIDKIKIFVIFTLTFSDLDLIFWK